MRALFAAVILLCYSTAATAQGPIIPAVTLIGLLNSLSDQLNQVIFNARSAGKAVIIEAGREVSIAIANVKNVYAESLDKTFSELDKATQTNVTLLRDMVSDVSNKTDLTLDEVAKRTQQIINTLPFAQGQPQVTSVSPRFVVPNRQSYPVPLIFRGNFAHSTRIGYEPLLEIGGKTYKTARTQITSQELVFMVPVEELFPISATTSSTRQSIQFTSVSLNIPWHSESFFGLKEVRREDRYGLIIGALPETPGKITLIRRISGDKIVSQTVSGGPYHQASTREAGNNDRIDVPYVVTPPQGWSVVRGTSKFNVNASQGVWSQTFVSDDGNRVVYNVTTIHKKIGSSGSVDFYIRFEATQTEKSYTTIVEPIALSWGDTISRPYPPGTWKLVFDAFDGTHFETELGGTTNKFLQVRQEGTSLSIGTDDPKKLAWP